MAGHNPQSTTNQYELSAAVLNQFGAHIVSVEPQSPADRAGLTPGMYLIAAEGEVLTDLIHWQWLADGSTVTVECATRQEIDAFLQSDDEEAEIPLIEVELERVPGESWGLAFETAVFDGVRICRNNCTFCFMRMLPPDARKTLMIRDDDYRLSFLEGNFVTFTNMKDEDVNRVIEQRLSPLNMSLHAISDEVRKKLIGPYHKRGITVLETLLNAGIEIHTQIVLIPGVNDGEELVKTLTYVEQYPEITSLAIVPLGFTQFQKRFDRSFNDPADARAVIELVRPFQERARTLTGTTKFHLADEFYLMAQIEPPEAYWYDDFAQYYDGIGMYRSFVDEWKAILKNRRLPHDCSDVRLTLFTGEGFAQALQGLVATSPFAEYDVEVSAVKNKHFGGNVDVAGLLCADDLLDACQHVDRSHEDKQHHIIIPARTLNHNDMFLDDVSQEMFRNSANELGFTIHFAPEHASGLIALMDSILKSSTSQGVINDTHDSQDTESEL